ncbi:unnamed protein product [Allacma fusca]|uniref:Uncharacterized protein n=1 Tax=Allacma fusca TaxID=39272 RepID=A0A8J2PCU2_9HEXA|nr:unnamed protein product [Allacma fusca]
MQAEFDSMKRINQMQVELEEKKLAVDGLRLEREAEIEKKRLEMEKMMLDEDEIEADYEEDEFVPPINVPRVTNSKPKVESWLKQTTSGAFSFYNIIANLLTFTSSAQVRPHRTKSLSSHLANCLCEAIVLTSSETESLDSQKE